MGNGVSPPRPLKSVPRVFAYQSRLSPFPFRLRVANDGTGQLPPLKPAAQLTGPCHILSMAEASVGVRHVLSLGVHAALVSAGSFAALYVQVRGSVSTPSVTPSSASQASTALAVA